MKVELISYTGIGHPDPMYAARLLAYTKATRLEQGAASRAAFDAMPLDRLKEELEYMASTLPSSWEFADCTFEITGVTRAFTHQLVRTRHGSYAQQAQRVVDMSSFQATVPETVAADADALNAWDDLMRHIARTYTELAARKVPTQDCRGVLPTNVHTNIIAKFNLRTLAELLGKRRNLRAQGEYADVARGMEAEVLRVWPWAEPFLNPERLRTPALDAILMKELGSAGPVDKPHVNAALKELDRLRATWI